MIGFVKTSLQSIKDLCQLDFFTKSLTFCFVLIYWLCWAESTASTAALQQKRSDILVVLWQKCQIFKVNYLWLKKFDTKINAILLISELMASVRKVLRHFHRHGEIFITVLMYILCLARKIRGFRGGRCIVIFIISIFLKAAGTNEECRYTFGV